jgi:RNA 3'-terminal phosphate cyclase-like protein
LYPLGGGEVFFRCPIVKTVKPVNFTDEGRILKIRGTVFVSKLSPLVANRCIESARSLLNKFIPDVYLYTDACKGAESGKSAGFGASLVAESTSGVLISADYCAKPGETPEEVGLKVAKMLYTQIYYGGCVDLQHQWLYALMIALTPEDVSVLSLGKLSEFTIEYLRDILAFFGVKVNIKADGDRISLTGVGSGYVNLNKAMQ